MAGIAYASEVLHIDGVPLPDLAAQYGTPLYVYSQPSIIETAQQINDGLAGSTPHLICYAVKANPALALIQTFARMGFGADVTSGGELYRALQAGIQPDRIVYSGVGKTPVDVDMALRTGIRAFHIESAWEVGMITRLVIEQPAPVALRVNPDIDAHTHPGITTGIEETKFGIAWEDIPEVVAAIQSEPHLALIGLSMHIGSQITELEPYQQAAARIITLARDLLGNGIGLRYLDFGGGLGVRYQNEAPPDPGTWARMLRSALGDIPLDLLVEPGRALVAEAGILMARVLGIKRRQRKTFVIVDAGMNDLIRPMLYGAHHPIWPVVSQPNAPQIIADIVGPVCETTDCFARDYPLPAMHPGDLIAILQAGAYGSSMASNYNSRLRPAEVLIDKHRAAHLIRQREEYEDLIRGERLLDR